MHDLGFVAEVVDKYKAIIDQLLQKTQTVQQKFKKAIENVMM